MPDTNLPEWTAPPSVPAVPPPPPRTEDEEIIRNLELLENLELLDEVQLFDPQDGEGVVEKKR